MVELLVVVILIAVLAALLLPALSRATGIAQNTQCKGNLRQVGVALALYAEDHEVYPLDSHRPEIRKLGGKSWLEAVRGYGPRSVERQTIAQISDDRMFRATWTQCPSLLTRKLDPSVFGGHGPSSVVALKRAGFRSYGYNAYGHTSSRIANEAPLGLGYDDRWAQPSNPWRRRYLTAPSDITNPDQMIGTADGRDFISYLPALHKENGRSHASANAYGLDPTLSGPDAIGRRHRRGGNAAAMDGHVEYWDSSHLETQSPDLDRRFNRDNEVHVLQTVRNSSFKGGISSLSPSNRP